MKNWIKFHIISYVSNVPGNTVVAVVEYQKRLWTGDTPMFDAHIESEFDRLVRTGQLVVKDHRVYKGVPLFEEGVAVSSVAAIVADSVIDDLLGRRGIGNELERLDEDVMAEVKNTIAAIVDKKITENASVEVSTFTSLSPEDQRLMIQKYIGSKLFNAVTSPENPNVRVELESTQQQFKAFLRTDPDTARLFADTYNILDWMNDDDGDAPVDG
jgi:hypothetical protein